jgi:hypothetical protein
MDSIDEQYVDLNDFFFDYDIVGSETLPLERETLIFGTGSVVSILLEYEGSVIIAD